MDDDKNGRVTTREFYEAQLDMRKDMNAGFVEIKEKIASGLEEQALFHGTIAATVEENKDKIDKLQTKSNIWDMINSIFAGVVAYFELRRG
jgi:hypothetical protein